MKKYLLGIASCLMIAVSAHAEILSVEVEDHTPNSAYREAGGVVKINVSRDGKMDSAMSGRNIIVAGPNLGRKGVVPDNVHGSDSDFGKTIKVENIFQDADKIYVTAYTPVYKIDPSTHDLSYALTYQLGGLVLNRNPNEPKDQRVVVTVTEFDPATRIVKGTISQM